MRDFVENLTQIGAGWWEVELIKAVEFLWIFMQEGMHRERDHAPVWERYLETIVRKVESIHLPTRRNTVAEASGVLTSTPRNNDYFSVNHY